MIRVVSCVGAVLSSAFALGCASSATTPSGPPPGSGTAKTSPASKDSGQLDRLMRTRMNRSYTQLVFFVLDSATDVDFTKIEAETVELRGAVRAVRSLPTPAVAKSDEALSVYVTFNELLQRDADKFAEAVTAKDRPKMETLLTKIGKTCDDCHRFFRVEVKEAQVK